LARDLVALPWQVSAVLAVTAFAGIRWMLPELIPHSPLLVGVRALAGPLSWVALCGFGALALLSTVGARLRHFPACKSTLPMRA